VLRACAARRGSWSSNYFDESRRLIPPSCPRIVPRHTVRAIVHYSKFRGRMSALGGGLSRSTQHLH
jgi:hypothetical protein